MTDKTAAIDPMPPREFWRDIQLGDHDTFRRPIRCFSCGAENGHVQMAVEGGEVIGCTVHLHPALVHKGKPHDGLARWGIPDRVLRGRSDRDAKFIVRLEADAQESRTAPLGCTA